MPMREMTREELISEMNRFSGLYHASQGQLEQERVQHAGCLTAAEGAISPEHVAIKGQYGWSLAYQTVLDLRRKYENLQVAAKEAMNNLGVPGPDYPAPVAAAYDLLKTALNK